MHNQDNKDHVNIPELIWELKNGKTGLVYDKQHCS